MTLADYRKNYADAKSEDERKNAFAQLVAAEHRLVEKVAPIYFAQMGMKNSRNLLNTGEYDAYLAAIPVMSI